MNYTVEMRSGAVMPRFTLRHSKVKGGYTKGGYTYRHAA
jgi:hypothetical protein